MANRPTVWREPADIYPGLSVCDDCVVDQLRRCLDVLEVDPSSLDATHGEVEAARPFPQGAGENDRDI